MRRRSIIVRDMRLKRIDVGVGAMTLVNHAACCSALSGGLEI